MSHFRRANGRCPSKDFLGDLQSKMADRFSGSFKALTRMGASYENRQRFTPLSGDGKPLWEFKEHDHRLYCLRTITGPDGRFVEVVLLSGWIKDKKGKAREEARKIETAKSLHREYQEKTGRSR